MMQSGQHPMGPDQMHEMMRQHQGVMPMGGPEAQALIRNAVSGAIGGALFFVLLGLAKSMARR